MFRKAVKNGVLKTSGIGAVAMMIGIAASEVPITPVRIAVYAASIVWIALLLVANSKK